MAFICCCWHLADLSSGVLLLTSHGGVRGAGKAQTRRRSSWGKQHSRCIYLFGADSRLPERRARVGPFVVFPTTAGFLYVFLRQPHEGGQGVSSRRRTPTIWWGLSRMLGIVLVQRVSSSGSHHSHLLACTDAGSCVASDFSKWRPWGRKGVYAPKGLFGSRASRNLFSVAGGADLVAPIRV